MVSAAGAAPAPVPPDLPGPPGSRDLPSAVLNGIAGVPANGALISTTERKMSGRTTEHHAATGDPKSWPTTAATDRYQNADTSATMSVTSFTVRHGLRSSSNVTSVPPVRPYPRRSGAIT